MRSPPRAPGLFPLMWKWEVLCWPQVYRAEHYKLVKTTNISRHVISRVTSQSVLSGYNFWQAKPAAWEKASVGRWLGPSTPLPRSRFLSCTARAWLFALQRRYISTNWRPCLRDTISAVTPLLLIYLLRSVKNRQSRCWVRKIIWDWNEHYI